MRIATAPDVTDLLLAWNQGERQALDQLMPMVVAELRRVAASYLQRERPDHTLQPTALVHELYLRLVDQRRVAWNDRVHFFAAAARTMRHILVDHARGQRSQKRGSGSLTVPLADAADVSLGPEADLLALDEALEQLSQREPRQARVVELRFFAGLTLAETAAALGVGDATVSRDWAFAKAWLYRELKGGAIVGGAMPGGESRSSSPPPGSAPTY